MIRYIIFDMDGVLVGSEKAIRAACMKMFERRGLTVQPDDFIPFTGMGENRFIGGVAEKYGKTFTPDMKAEAYKIYGEVARDNVIVYDGVKQLIMDLKESGYKVAVASAADDVKVKVNLACIGLTKDDFHAIVTGDDVSRHKPDPEAFLLACEKLGGVPGQSVVVEDAVAGCQAAKAAGMKCIGVMSTFDADALKAAGADFVVAKTPDVLAIVERMNETDL